MLSVVVAAAAALSVALPKLGEIGPVSNPLPTAWLGRAGGVQQVLGLIVSPSGAVEQCKVVLSSGQTSFDEGVCGALRSTTFAPARDVDGSAVYGVQSLPFAWTRTGAATKVINPDVDLTLNKLPDGAPDHPITRLALAVDEHGRVESCSVVESSGLGGLDAAACSQGVAAAQIRATTDKHGHSVRSVQSLDVGFGAYAPIVLKRDPRYTALGDAGPYFPERAQRLNVSGYAILRCHAKPDGSLVDCLIEEAVPNSFAFGEAAQRMAQTQWMKVAPGGESSVLVRVDFPASAGVRLP